MARTPRHPLQIVEQPKGVRQPAVETPRQRLQRIGPDRVNRAVKAVRLLHQLANPAVYDVRPKDRDQIVGALTQEIEHLRYVLENPGKAPPIVRFEDDDDE